MDAADSWERLSDALLGPFERDIINGLTDAYSSLEGRIEIAYKRALSGGNDMPLRQLLILRQQLEQELQTMRLPPQLQQVVNQALLDGQQASDFWALAELNKVKQEAMRLNPEQAAAVFADAIADPTAILTPAMVQQNPSAMIAAAQRQNALASYAAGGRGTQAFAALNRLVEVDLRGRIIGGVEFHLAQGDSWRQLRKTLQNSVELTKSRAQTVARTEMAAAMVEGTKLRYEAEGIQQVQWQAVGSSRTCGYCAPRHGKVYKLGEVVTPAHPNCRCTVTPWDPKWVELGLVDPQAEAKSRADVLADLEAAGKKPISGPSPFEKALGQERAPEALWTPPRIAAANSGLNSSIRQPVGLGLTRDPDPLWMDELDFDELPSKLGYNDYGELDLRVESIGKWTGAQYEKMRAHQLASAVSNNVTKLSDSARKYVENALNTNGLDFEGLDRDAGPLVEWAEDLLSRSPRYQGKVYRGVNLDSEEEVRSLLDGLRGNTVTALESWTTEADIASSFSTGSTKKSPGQYRVILETENKHGVSIQGFSSKKGEREVLMPSGVRYEAIDEVSQSTSADGAQVYKVKVRQI